MKSLMMPKIHVNPLWLPFYERGEPHHPPLSKGEGDFKYHGSFTKLSKIYKCCIP
jgi:hypothetical protein